MEKEYQEEHPDGEVRRHGACHMRNNGQVGLQVWPADRHATLSENDTVSYPYGKGNKSALKVLMNNDVWSRK